MRTTPLKGRYVLIIIKPFKEFSLAQLSGVRGVKPKQVPGVTYHSLAEAEWDIFKRRWTFLSGVEISQEDCWCCFFDLQLLHVLRARRVLPIEYEIEKRQLMYLHRILQLESEDPV